jgi:oxygen-independent coproporphyrinogen-3 oxidase
VISHIFHTALVKFLYRQMSSTFTAGDESRRELDFSHREVALYVHFPFCDTICRYCPFSRSANTSEIDTYMDAVYRELELLAEQGKLNGTTISSMAFGGGTPSLIPENHLRKLMGLLQELFPNFSTIQKTMECTPESITTERLLLFRELGINRISVGVQSMQSSVLDELGRNSTPQLIAEKLSLVDKRWSGYWSCDLIYGFDSHSESEFLADIERLLSYHPDHLSLFPLVNSDQNNRQQLSILQFRKMSSMHREASKLLQQHNFNAYSIEDFSKSNDAELKYQKDVWQFPQKDLLILGTGAFGIANSIQYKKTAKRDKFIQESSQGLFSIDHYLPISAKREKIFRPLMGFHYNRVPLSEKIKFGIFLQLFGIVTKNSTSYTLTPKGRFITSLLWAKIMIDRML